MSRVSGWKARGGRFQYDCVFFFFNDTATTEIYTLSLHDALPICWYFHWSLAAMDSVDHRSRLDRKSTRLNSSHLVISYAVFCLKKKKNNITNQQNKDTVRSATGHSQHNTRV